MADGTIYIRKGGTIPWRLQNPGDVRPNHSNASGFRRKGDFKGFTFLGYYLPVGYVPPSNKLNEYDSNDLNNELFNSNNSTTNDVNRDDAT
ncbi:hypothetical protein MKU92_004637 [Salmonella enterica]|nr:hypothetical protein [Salmonella enterica subsp. enterica]EDP9826634.1 hypothetical protein [Salmonella enterica subsp. enterica]EIX6435618.1 hypothetical protein [Salmonella enterica]EJX0634483.1 hypothetical protein [Salmonella enterica]